MSKSVFAAAALVLGLAVVGRAGPDPAKGEGPKILVVHMQRIIDETLEGRQFVLKLNEEMAAEQKRLADEAAALQEKVKELSKAQLADRTPEFYKEYEEAMQTSAKLEMRKNLFLLKKGDEIARATNELIRGAQQEASAIMRERKADIVLISKMGPLQINSDKEWKEELVFRRVLVAGTEANITDEVIKRMDDWFKQNKAGNAMPNRPAGNAEEKPEGDAKAGD